MKEPYDVMREKVRQKNRSQLDMYQRALQECSMPSQGKGKLRKHRLNPLATPTAFPIKQLNKKEVEAVAGGAFPRKTIAIDNTLSVGVIQFMEL